MTNSEQDGGFLSRWSRRKLNDETEAEPSESVADKEVIQPEDSEQKLDEPENNGASTSEQDLPLWQQKDVDPELKRSALRDLFRQAEFNHRDGLNDYDHDYTQERKLGDIVTAQMKRMIKLTQDKAQPEVEPVPEIETIVSASASAEKLDNPTDKNEDDKSA